MVLPHLDGLGFGDSSWESLAFLRSGWGSEVGGRREWEEGRDRGGTVVDT